jgi:hypothetical protein
MSVGADELFPSVAVLQDVRKQKAQHAKTNVQALLRQPKYGDCETARLCHKERLFMTKNAKRFFAKYDWIFNCDFPARNAICNAYKSLG